MDFQFMDYLNMTAYEHIATFFDTVIVHSIPPTVKDISLSTN